MDSRIFLIVIRKFADVAATQLPSEWLHSSHPKYQAMAVARTCGWIIEPTPFASGFFNEPQAVTSINSQGMIMNIHPAQPEEVALVMREMKMEKREASAEKQNRETSLPTRNAGNGWSTGNTSAYRAAYIKTHNLDL